MRVQSSVYGVMSNQAASGTFAEADGSLVCKGDATTFDDLLGAITTVKVLGTGVSYVDAEQTIVFTDAADYDTDYAAVSFQVRHRWKAGSSIFPHIHWEQASNAVPNFLLEYRWQRNLGTKTTAWTKYVCRTLAVAYTTGTINQICYGAAVVPPAGYNISDIIQVRLYRDTTNDSTSFAGVDGYTGSVSVTGIDIHIEEDTLGSRTEYSK